MQPLVSVVIPAYNAACSLPTTLQSVIAQTYEHWEALVVNDGSTDNSAEIIARYCVTDSRFRLINQTNQGVSASRNRGVREAKGEVIAFLDADDSWLAEKLQVHVDYMDAHPQAIATFARVELVYADGHTRLTNNITPRVAPHELFYANPTVTTSNLVIQKQAFEKLGGFDSSMQHDEDIELLFRIAHHPEMALVGIDRVLVRYLIQECGLSSDLAKMEEGWQTLMRKATQIDPELVQKHYSQAHSAKLQYLARQTLRLNMPATLGVSLINRAVVQDWTSFYRNPKALAIALLAYGKLLTFNRLRVSL